METLESSRSSRDLFHVAHISLGVMVSVFLLAIYVRPVSRAPRDDVRTYTTHSLTYVVEFKYLSGQGKYEQTAMRQSEKSLF